MHIRFLYMWLRLVWKAGVTAQATACDGDDSFAADEAIATALATAIAQALLQATASCESTGPGTAETSACAATTGQINAVAEATVCCTVSDSQAAQICT